MALFGGLNPVGILPPTGDDSLSASGVSIGVFGLRNSGSVGKKPILKTPISFGGFLKWWYLKKCFFSSFFKLCLLIKKNRWIYGWFVGTPILGNLYIISVSGDIQCRHQAYISSSIRILADSYWIITPHFPHSKDSFQWLARLAPIRKPKNE